MARWAGEKLRITKKGMFWHLEREYLEDRFWLFRKKIWLTEFPWYSTNKEMIKEKLIEFKKQ